MRLFRWLPADPIPYGLDLRRRGWTIPAPGDEQAEACPALADSQWQRNFPATSHDRAAIILVGIDDSLQRASALAEGYGEVLGSAVTLAELEQRVHRVARAMEVVQRRRRHGSLELDLLLRDGLVRGRRLGLHPREFGLLWRLAQVPGEAVSPDDLLAEVWRVNFRPETNSLAVHVCRLRAKLASAGLKDVVSTSTEGGYALAPEPGRALPPGDGLDAYLRGEVRCEAARPKEQA